MEFYRVIVTRKLTGPGCYSRRESSPSFNDVEMLILEIAGSRLIKLLNDIIDPAGNESQCKPKLRFDPLCFA